MLRRKKNHDPDQPPKKTLRQRIFITIDLNNPKHRRRLIIFNVFLFIILSAFVYVNYEVYEYTESAEFCGTACHVMDPQFVRYEESAHANVECVECHIGSGAEFYLKAKVDGLKQVYAVMTDSYELPIKGPVHNLRPARETCETCHSPTNFKDNVIKTIVHYDNDQENTRIQSTLILKMGGWSENKGMAEGIHWHITNPVYYIAADEQRQAISWVGVEQPDGSMKEYFSRDMLNMAQTSFVEDSYEEDEVRLMDCIDCHNRAAHYIPTPQEMVDNAIEDGVLNQNLPYVRNNAIDILMASYHDQTEAYAAIDTLSEFYAYIQLDTDRSAKSSTTTSSQEEIVSDTLLEIKKIYDLTNFPELEMDWRTNPNNARHTPTPGCFRCHDGKHINVDETGNEIQAISVKCNLCHTVPIVGRGDELLIESPVIVGSKPDSHEDFSWTIEHRDVEDAETQECYQCHGQGFCNNGVCHNLSHPPDMLFTHAEEYRLQGDEVCYTCHQDILCSRCHPGGIISNP